MQLSASVVSVFLVTSVLLGLDLWSGAIVTLSVGLILVNLLGLMFWWSISLNAVSLVNLVMGLGISVEFCCHVVRSFACVSGGESAGAGGGGAGGDGLIGPLGHQPHQVRRRRRPRLRQLSDLPGPNFSLLCLSNK